jgi:hypothetical protein
MVAGAVGAVLALAGLAAGDAGVVALAVLLLALAALAVAPFALVPGVLQLVADGLPGLLHLVVVVLVVAAPVSVALLRAQPPLPEALAVHLQALRLLARAPALPLLRDRRRSTHLLRLLLQVVVDRGLRLLGVRLLRNVLVEADRRAETEVFLCFYELESVSDVGDRGQSEEALPKQVDLAHILYCSVKNI